MRNFGLALAGMLLAGLGYSQGYTENWRAITTPTQQFEFIQWERIVTTANNEVVVLGTVRNGEPPPLPFGPRVLDQTRTIIVAKYAEDGTPLWSTRDFTGSNEEVLAGDLEVDGTGNVYISYITGFGTAQISSYASATGTPRWAKPLAVDISTDRPVKLAVRSAGNSTFVYAGLSQVANNLQSFEILRLNSATGTTTQNLPITGTTRAVLNSLRTDLNGNIVFGAGIDNDGIVRKLNQSFTQVWNVAIPLSSSAEVALNTTSNTAFVFSIAKLGGINRVTSLNATNGAILIQKELPKGKGFGNAQPSIFGSWWALTSVDSQSAITGLTPTLSPFSVEFPFKGVRTFAVDSSGEAHFPAVGSAQAPVFAIRRTAGAGLFEVVLNSDAGAICVTTDSLGRVLAAGGTFAGEAVVFQLDQQFLTNTDVIVRDFAGPLTIESPGVLANDTNWLGGTLSIFTPPTEGTVILNQDGSFTYTPGANYDGTDQFQYRVTKNGVPRTATCVVKQLVITQVNFPPDVIGEQAIIGNVVINNGGFPAEYFPAVSLSSPAVTVGFLQPFFPGKTSSTVFLNTQPVNANQNVTVTFSASGQSRSDTFVVKVGGLKDIKSVGNAPLIVGETSTLILRLTGVVQEPRTLNIERSGVSGPNSVTVPAGSDNVTFSVQPTLAAGQTATIEIFTGNGLREFTFPIQAKPILSAFSLEDPILYAGTTFRLKATLDGKAGTAGINVPVLDNSNQVALVSAAKVPAGQTIGFANGTANLAAANTTVTFSANFGGVNKSFQALVRQNLLETFTVAPAVIGRRGLSKGTVTFNWIAQGSGQTVGVSTDRPDVVTVPAKFVVAAGQTTGSFNIQGGAAAGTANISVTVGQKKLTKQIVVTP